MKIIDILKIDILPIFNLLTAIIKKAAFNNWSVAQLTEDLKSVKQLTEDQKVILVKFWGLSKDKIHEILVQKSKFGSCLKSFEWRIDVKNKSASQGDINQPTAIIEMMTGKIDSNDNQVFLFELDKSELQNLLAQIKDLQGVINKRSTI